MKETVKVNLSGQLFNLDKDAYERLSKYLGSIENRFKHVPDEAKEILEDIEARIAELLQLKYSDTSSQVVTLDDIREIISKLGTADEIDDQEDSGQTDEGKKQYSQSFVRRKKRLYRNVDHAVFGGVCSGIASFWKIDPVWVRILFVLLFFAQLFGLIIYIIMWAIVPAAKTTAQKLEMEGEAVNVENIKKTVTKEYEKVRDGVKNIPQSKGYKNIESALSEFINTIGNILLIFVKVIGAIIAISLIVALIVVLLGFILGGAFFLPDHFFHHWNWNFTESWPQATWFGICLFLVIVIPILAIFAKLVRWLFNLPNRNRFLSGIGATVWVIAFISLIVLASTDFNRNMFRKSVESEYTFHMEHEHSLKIEMKGPDISNDYEHFHIFNYDFIWDDDYNIFYRNPDFEIQRIPGNEIKMEIIRNYICLDPDRQESYALKIVNYDWSMSEDTLLLDQYYACRENVSWRLPKMKVILYVPDDMDIIYLHGAGEWIRESSHHSIDPGTKMIKMPEND